jgi:hypothetical protein
MFRKYTSPCLHTSINHKAIAVSCWPTPHLSAEYIMDTSCGAGGCNTCSRTDDCGNVRVINNGKEGRSRGIYSDDVISGDAGNRDGKLADKTAGVRVRYNC